MSELKEIRIKLPNNLFEEVDMLANSESKELGEFIKEAIIMHLIKSNKEKSVEQMKKGYQEMAKINMLLAIESYEVENEVQEYYEGTLAECK